VSLLQVLLLSLPFTFSLDSETVQFLVVHEIV
jgi:hypothetical protein